MSEKILIGETLFSFHTPLPIYWRGEEKQFFYQGEFYKQHILINIQFVPQLPELVVQEQYCTEGLKIGLDNEFNEVRAYNALFLVGKPMYAVSVLKDSVVDIYFINDRTLWKNPNIRIWNLVHMERLLLRAGALVFHCSYLMYDGKAILFSAPSGTGKTTQAKLWEKRYMAHIVNGDKAIIQKKSNVWYACGYPFHGSADECMNYQYPIEAIVVVRQSKEDFIENPHLQKKMLAIYSETTINTWDSNEVNHALDLITELIKDVKVVYQHCTITDDACRTLYRYLKGE